MVKPGEQVVGGRGLLERVEQLGRGRRQQVRDARLHLDGWRAHLKSAEQSSTPSGSKLASIREEVEQAEDKLVSATEEAISLMKTVLDNPDPRNP